MEPKNPSPRITPVVITWSNTNSLFPNSELDAATMQALASIVDRLLRDDPWGDEAEQYHPRDELAELALLDAQVADDAECPEALAWITQAVQRVRRGD
jgi:hypothetical protein